MKKIYKHVFYMVAFIIGTQLQAATIVGSNYGGANLTPASGDVLSGTFTNVGTFHIQSGFTVYIDAGTILSISANTVLIEGILDGNGMGYSGGSIVVSGADGNAGAGTGGGGAGLYGPCVHGTAGGGGAYGGNGGIGSKTWLPTPAGAAGGTSYGNISTLSSIFMGSGGGSGGGYCPSPNPGYFYAGAGGNGGGAVEIITSTITITGTITVNGSNGQDGSWGGAGGGGAGGGINITASSGLISGTLTANGGNGGAAGTVGLGTSGGGGSGGRIKLSADICITGSTQTVTGGALGSGAQGIVSPIPLSYPDGNDATAGAAGTTFGGTNSCGKALNFDGTNDHVTVGNPSALGFSKTSAFTIESWIRPLSTATADQQIVSKLDNTIKGFGIQIGNGAGRNGIIEFYLIGDYGSNNALWIRSNYATDIRDNNWHHIAATYDGSNTLNNIHIFIDGVDYGSTSLATASIAADITNTADLHIGSYHFSGTPNEFFIGDMDETRIWNISRTCSEIKSTRLTHLVGNEANLVAYYQYNQGVPLSNNAGVTSLTDLTTNALNGTLTNFALTGATSNWVTPGSGVIGTVPNGQPEINVTGNAVSILDEDLTPSAGDHTDFGSAVTLTRVFTIQNTGGAALNISSIVLSGANAGDYTITGAPSSVAAASSATFNVNFFPTVYNVARNATVTINSDDCDEAAYNYAITAIGLPASPGGVSTNLNMWNRANSQAFTVGGSSTLATNGQTVDQWNDISPSANNLLQATNANKPVYKVAAMNFNPALGYSKNQFLDRAASMAITGTSSYTYFVVFKANTSIGGAINDGIGDYIVDRTTASNELAGLKFVSTGNPLGMQKRYDNNSGLGGTQNSITLGMPQIAEYHRNYNVEFGVRVNNGANSSTGDNTNSLTPPIMRLGRHQSTTNGGLDGDIAEVIVYSRYPSSTELAQINSYLAIKYGVTLDQTTAQAYYNSAGTNVYHSDAGGTHDAYDSDIAGIARDAGTALDQRRSMSVNINSRLLIEKPTGFSSDNTYLVWGSNGGSATTTAVGAHPSYTYRLNRDWRADITGTPGPVTVKIVIGGSLVNSGNLSDYALLRDNADNDFTAGASSVNPNSIVGDTLVFNNVTFTNGDYFTLGTKLDAPGPGHVTSNLQVWLKGNLSTFTDNGITLATSGQAVQQWNDVSSGRIFRQTASANKPTLVNSINFNPTLEFFGNQYVDLLTSLGIAGNQDYSYFAVFLPKTINNGTATGGDGSYIIDRQSATNELTSLKFMNSNNLAHQFRYNDLTGLSTNSSASLSINNVYLAQYHRVVGTEFGLAVNGGVKTTSGSNSNSLVPPAMRVGRHATTAGNGLIGELGEVVVYGMYPTVTELSRINSYLGIKYGITLDQTTGQDYVNSAGSIVYNSASGGTQDAFDRDIAGIGRDDLSALDQRQSSSSNPGSMLTIGNGTIAVNNVSNGNPFTTDNSFFIAGHNGLDAINSNTDFGTTLNSEVILGRLTRYWSATETGTVGTLRMRFDMSQVYGTSGLNSNDLQHVRLLVDPDGVFATGATSISPATFNNLSGIVEFNWDFAGATGFFFTIGTVNNALTPLPITLLDFTAQPLPNKVLLKWSTSQEINSNYFEIERSKDLKNWQFVVAKKAAGNSVSRRDYADFDVNPYRGVSYYRLKVVDNNNEVEYSSPVAVNYEAQLPTTLIYPQPASDQLFVVVNTDNRPTLVLTDALGRQITLNATWNDNTASIDLKDFAAGLYNLVIQYEDSKEVKQILIQK